MRIRTCGLDPDEQQPLYAGDQGDANGDDDGEHGLDCATGDENGDMGTLVAHVINVKMRVTG